MTMGYLLFPASERVKLCHFAFRTRSSLFHGWKRCLHGVGHIPVVKEGQTILQLFQLFQLQNGKGYHSEDEKATNGDTDTDSSFRACA